MQHRLVAHPLGHQEDLRLRPTVCVRLWTVSEADIAALFSISPAYEDSSRNHTKIVNLLPQLEREASERRSAMIRNLQSIHRTI